MTGDSKPPRIRSTNVSHEMYEHPVPLSENVIGTLTVSALEKHLFRASCAFARFALRNYTSDTDLTRLQSATAAGSAVEYLLRSVIVAADPVLLAHRNSLDSVIALSKAVRKTPFDPKLLRTIDASDAALVVAKLHPTMKTGTEVKEILALRNATAHMGIELGSDLQKAVVQVVRVIEELLSFVKEDESSYWGTNLMPLVREMKKKANDALLHRVRSKIAAAEMRFKEVTALVNHSALEPMLVILESRDVPYALLENDHEESRTCPACNRKGRLSFVKEFDPESLDVWSDIDDPSNTTIIIGVMGVPSLFQCPVCELLLEGDELSLYPDLRKTVRLPDEESVPSDIDNPDWAY